MQQYRKHYLFISPLCGTFLDFNPSRAFRYEILPSFNPSRSICWVMPAPFLWGSPRLVRWYCLCYTSLEQIIQCHWSVRSLILTCIFQVLSNYLMPLISQIANICLELMSLEHLFDAVDRSDPWYSLAFCKYSALSDAIHRSDRWHLLVFYKSWAMIRCHWSVISLIFVCILQVKSNYSMPLIGQIIYICLCFTSL